MNSGCSAPTHSGSHVSACFADELVQPQVARRLERDVAAGAPVDDDVADALAAAHAERLVDDRLERQVLAAARLLVGGDHRDRAGVDDALLQRLRREAAEHDRVRRADARAGLHRDHAFDRHRHVDEDAIALPDAERLEPVGEPAHAVIELPVGDLRHRAVVGLEDDRDLVRVAVREIAVEAVVGDIELAVVEPLVERRVGLVERPRERLLPQHLVPRELRPETGEIRGGARVERVEVGLLDIRLRDELARRLEDPAFVRYRFDRGHALISSRGQAAPRPLAFVGSLSQSNQTRAQPAIRQFDVAQPCGGTQAGRQRC